MVVLVLTKISACNLRNWLVACDTNIHALLFILYPNPFQKILQQINLSASTDLFLKGSTSFTFFIVTFWTHSKNFQNRLFTHDQRHKKFIHEGLMVVKFGTTSDHPVRGCVGGCTHNNPIDFIHSVSRDEVMRKFHHATQCSRTNFQPKVTFFISHPFGLIIN